jgi:hypothetical protein
VDWLEDFLPFLRTFDGGDGALEIALVAAVAAVVGVIAYRLWQKRRPRTE